MNLKSMETPTIQLSPIRFIAVPALPPTHHFLEGQTELWQQQLTAEQDEPIKEPSQPVLCGHCFHEITRKQDRVGIDGRFYHYFQNPAGIGFHIATYQSAPGCSSTGPNTEDFTWFSGYAWSFAHCEQCKLHLGWCYANEGNRFFGLIVDFIIEPN